MAKAERKALIKKIQEAREGRLLIVYITSTRSGHELQMADDAFRVIYDHLEAQRESAKKGVDLFIHSNGGSGTVPWRVVSLIRQYTGTEKFAVLVPHRAFSAATLVALGADEIVMHRMGCLGPIDPSVANAFNPPHPQGAGPLPISVEDVSAYFKLVKDAVGINHEEELIQALVALTDKIHPLALGNVQRHHSQSRMMARKLLKTHMKSEAQEHDINLLIDNLKSNLFFHGHPINREEALNDLKLKVVTPGQELESMMWELYLEYERELKLTEPFNPLREIALASSKAPSALPPPTTAEIIAEIGAIAKAGAPIGPGSLSEEQAVRLATEIRKAKAGSAATTIIGKVRVEHVPGAVVESSVRADIFRTDLGLERMTVPTNVGPQEVVKQEILWQRWETELEAAT